MYMRKFTRLTNAFSKKIENHCAAISLHFMYVLQFRSSTPNATGDTGDGGRC
jgi:hypothetical protein